VLREEVPPANAGATGIPRGVSPRIALYTVGPQITRRGRRDPDADIFAIFCQLRGGVTPPRGRRDYPPPSLRQRQERRWSVLLVEGAGLKPGDDGKPLRRGAVAG